MIDEMKPLYIVYPDETAGTWRIQAVPTSPDSFESRKALPEAWRGLRDEKLSEVSGIDGGIFVHASGFIGGTSHRFRSNLQVGLNTELTHRRQQNKRWSIGTCTQSSRVVGTECADNVTPIYQGHTASE